METSRQQKIARLIQQDLAEIFRSTIKEEGAKGILVSVTKVTVTPDLALAKIYVSIFPVSETKKIMEWIGARQSLIKHDLAQKTRNQLRKLPDLRFEIDDSLTYIDTIENALKGNENPIEDPELLAKRKRT